MEAEQNAQSQGKLQSKSLLECFDGDKMAICRISDHIENYERNHGFNQLQLFSQSMSIWSGIDMLVKALWHDSTIDILLKFRVQDGKRVDLNAVQINGIKILVPFILISKINFTLLPFYILTVEYFFGYDLSNIEKYTSDDTKLNVAYFYVYYYFIVLITAIVSIIYMINIYVHIKYLVPLYSKLFYIFHDKYYCDLTGSDSGDDDIIYWYLEHVFEQSESDLQIANDDTTTFGEHKSWIVPRLSKSIQCHFESLQSRPQVFAILLQFLHDANLVKTVFDYYPVRDC